MPPEDHLLRPQEVTWRFKKSAMRNKTEKKVALRSKTLNRKKRRVESEVQF